MSDDLAWTSSPSSPAATAPYGSRVRYKTRHESGEGTLALVWYGVCEVLDIIRHDGSRIHVYPDLGETVELVPAGIADTETSRADG